jgi:hypothetical protein
VRVDGGRRSRSRSSFARKNARAELLRHQRTNQRRSLRGSEWKSTVIARRRIVCRRVHGPSPRRLRRTPAAATPRCGLSSAPRCSRRGPGDGDARKGRGRRARAALGALAGLRTRSSPIAERSAILLARCETPPPAPSNEEARAQLRETAPRLTTARRRSTASGPRSWRRRRARRSRRGADARARSRWKAVRAPLPAAARLGESGGSRGARPSRLRPYDGTASTTSPKRRPRATGARSLAALRANLCARAIALRANGGSRRLQRAGRAGRCQRPR